VCFSHLLNKGGRGGSAKDSRVVVCSPLCVGCGERFFFLGGFPPPPPPALVCLNVKLNLLLCIVRGLKGLVAFLAEQPRQLKHLEWPGFQHTVCPLNLTLLRCLENCH
jgi:hypothetical protein